jgi:hypothetical protein
MRVMATCGACTDDEREHGLRRDVEWMSNREARRIHAARAVMLLMLSARHHIEAVLAAVIPVADESPYEESRDENSRRRLTDSRQVRLVRSSYSMCSEDGFPPSLSG